jgi:hypothetical protein
MPREESNSAGDKFAATTNLAVNSIEFCQAIFDEHDIRECLGGCDHRTMMPLPCNDGAASIPLQSKLLPMRNAIRSLVFPRKHTRRWAAGH